MTTGGEPGDDWTLVLRRQPTRIVEGQPEDGYSDVFELICCDCGDHPALEYREIPPGLQLVRGPYPVAAGVAAYGQHRRLHQRPGRYPVGGRFQGWQRTVLRAPGCD
jgi:hypothetical protein